MKCILLCGGYATRLRPYTLNKAKALLEIEENKPILNYILEQVNKIDEVDEIFILTNDKFYEEFENWKDKQNYPKKITVINDYTTCNEDKLGAIGDVWYAIKNAPINDDVLIVLGDNLFEFSLNGMIELLNEKNAPIIGGQIEHDKKLLQRLGVMEVGEKSIIKSFEEKPEEPKGNMKSLGFYAFPKETLKQVKEYLEKKNNPDAIGLFVKYLVEEVGNTYVYPFEGQWFDVGTVEALETVRKKYGKTKVITNKKDDQS